jgi:hypothetical protein
VIGGNIKNENREISEILTENSYILKFSCKEIRNCNNNERNYAELLSDKTPNFNSKTQKRQRFT